MKDGVTKGILSEYPIPKRMSDRIPGENVMDSGKYPSDNIGIMPFMFPDNKTFVFTTDEA